MDAREYFGVSFIKVEVLGDGRQRKLIDQVEEGKFGKLNLIFEDNTAVSCNATNSRGLVKAFGPETDAWPGNVVELTVGEIEYQGKMHPAILIHPISETTTPQPGKPRRGGEGPSGDMDDSIPF